MRDGAGCVFFSIFEFSRFQLQFLIEGVREKMAKVGKQRFHVLKLKVFDNSRKMKYMQQVRLVVVLVDQIFDVRKFLVQMRRQPPFHGRSNLVSVGKGFSRDIRVADAVRRKYSYEERGNF